MAGGLFAIDKAFFERLGQCLFMMAMVMIRDVVKMVKTEMMKKELATQFISKTRIFVVNILGTYDSGFDIWGGENLELRHSTTSSLLLFTLFLVLYYMN